MGGQFEKGNWDTIQSRIETIDGYCEEKEEIREIKGVSKEELLGIQYSLKHNLKLVTCKKKIAEIYP